MTGDTTATTTSFASSADGTSIAYERLGSGPALVLVDGAMCYRDFGPCRSLAEHLKDRFTVYFYDRRGRGESGDSASYAPEREVEDLAAIIEAAGGRPFVLGYSSGAALALHAAATGVPMAKLAAYEAPYVGLKPKGGVVPNHVAALGTLLARGERAKMVDYFMVDMVGAPRIATLMFRVMRPIFAKLKAVAPTLTHDAAILGDFSAPAAILGRVTVPTLVMGGGKAKPDMAKAVADVAAAVPGSVLRILPGQTHQVKDEAIAPELVQFFR